MRLFKYKCPKGDKSGFNKGQCWYEWKAVDEIDNCCINCGVSSKETNTVWDKAYSLYLDVVPYDYRPKNLWYTFKCWAWKRHTTIKPRTLDHKWCDKVELLPHMVFEILCRFVEDELGPERERVKQADCWEAAYKEMDELYEWWTKEYPLLQKDLWEREGYSLDKEQALTDLVTENAKRVLDVRPYMWT